MLRAIPGRFSGDPELLRLGRFLLRRFGSHEATFAAMDIFPDARVSLLEFAGLLVRSRYCNEGHAERLFHRLDLDADEPRGQSSASAAPLPESEAHTLCRMPAAAVADPSAVATTPPLPEWLSTGSQGVLAAATSLAQHRPALCCAGARLPCQVERWDCGYANLESLCATIAATHPSLGAASRLRRVKGHLEIQRLVGYHTYSDALGCAWPFVSLSHPQRN